MSEMRVTEIISDNKEYRMCLRDLRRGVEQCWGIFNIIGWRLSRKMKWDYEPLPSSRTDAWIKSHSFTEDEAKKILEKYDSGELKDVEEIKCQCQNH